MKLLLGLLSSGLLALSAWHYGPEEAYVTAMSAMTPGAETVLEVHEAIAALISSFGGPGEIAPQD